MMMRIEDDDDDDDDDGDIDLGDIVAQIERLQGIPGDGSEWTEESLPYHLPGNNIFCLMLFWSTIWGSYINPNHAEHHRIQQILSDLVKVSRLHTWTTDGCCCIEQGV